MVTSDPVSTLAPRANQPKPKGVKRWLNIYITYDQYRARYDDFISSDDGYSPPKYKPRLANDIAMIGGPWERCLYADQNHTFFTGTGDEHARAHEMFNFFRRDVEAIK